MMCAAHMKDLANSARVGNLVAADSPPLALVRPRLAGCHGSHEPAGDGSHPATCSRPRLDRRALFASWILGPSATGRQDVEEQVHDFVKKWVEHAYAVDRAEPQWGPRVHGHPHPDPAFPSAPPVGWVRPRTCGDSATVGPAKAQADQARAGRDRLPEPPRPALPRRLPHHLRVSSRQGPVYVTSGLWG